MLRGDPGRRRPLRRWALDRPSARTAQGWVHTLRGTDKTQSACALYCHRVLRRTNEVKTRYSRGRVVTTRKQPNSLTYTTANATVVSDVLHAQVIYTITGTCERARWINNSSVVTVDIPKVSACEEVVEGFGACDYV